MRARRISQRTAKRAARAQHARVSMVTATRSTGMSAPQLDRQQPASAFLADWTPARLLQTWIEDVSALGVKPASLLQTLDTQAFAGCSGQRRTLTYLRETAGDAASTAAVLLSASLFMRVERARARYPRDHWPPFAVAQGLLGFARERGDYRWEPECESTLPAHDSEAGLVIGSTQQLVRFLAVEHARVLHRFAAVQLVFSLPAPTHSLSAPRDPARRRDPRWAELTREELEALIWQKPQRELARELGVSESTLAKRCKLLSITKPARGFWRKTRPAAASGSHG